MSSADKSLASHLVSQEGWQDIGHDTLLTSFASANLLNTKSLLSDNCVVKVLPNNRALCDLASEHHIFALHSKEVLNALAEGGLGAHLYDDGKERRELVLKSADVVLPLLLFIGTQGLSVGLGILSSWIYDKWVKPKQSPPSVKFEYAQVEQESGTILRWRRIEGPADEVSKLLAAESASIAGDAQKMGARIIQSASRHVGLNSPDERMKKQADESLVEARHRISLAKLALAQGETASAEALYRQSLQKIREACLWQPNEPAHMEYLHRVGRVVHDTFGCRLNFKDGQYRVTCPVMLSHNRLGFSIGGSAQAICAICGQEYLTCPHLAGRHYDNVVAVRRESICNICGESKCEHQPGESYDEVEAFCIVTKLDLDHVAMVRNPANPLCVIHEHTLRESDVLEMLPRREADLFAYGATVLHCHHCTQCHGPG